MYTVVSCCSTFKFNNAWHNFLKMVDVFIAFFNRHCLPKTPNSMNALLLCSRLDFSLARVHAIGSLSMGFRSGDSERVIHQIIPWSTMSQAKLEMCLGSLSCMKRWAIGNFSWMKGTSVWPRISVNKNLSIMPSKMQIPVWSLLEIPAYTWTFTGCFALQG